MQIEEEFDLEAFAQIKAMEYADRRGTFEDFARLVRRIVVENLRDREIKVQIVQERAKEVISFKSKCLKRKQSGDELGQEISLSVQPKYDDPLRQITDLAAIRIIVYSLQDLVVVRQLVTELFDKIEDVDKGLERVEQNNYGYKSIHILAKLDKGRLVASPELRRFSDLVCEIQIRTILQHAWAEIEHAIRYKTDNKIDMGMQESLVAVAGLLQIGDKELQAISDKKLVAVGAVEKSLKEQVIETSGESLETGPAANTRVGTAIEKNRLRVKDLVLAEKYDEAISVYNAQIKLQPDSHTLLLGRAKALYLNGDSSAALSDLDQLFGMSGLSPKIVNDASKLLSWIKGDSFEESLTYSNRYVAVVDPRAIQNSEFEGVVVYAYDELVKSGEKHLREGNAGLAYRDFSHAEDLGYNRAFATIRKAVAFLMLGNISEVEYFMEALKERADTPMQIIIVAVNILVLILSHVSTTMSVGLEQIQRIDTEIERLKGLMTRFSSIHNQPFNLDYQPLAAFFLNLDQKKLSQWKQERIGELHRVLKS